MIVLRKPRGANKTLRGLASGVVMSGLLVLVVVCSGVYAESGPANKEKSSFNGAPNPRVLVLHSYHAGFTWTDNVNKGLRSVFFEQAPEVELLFEFMDVKHLDTEAYFRQLRALYRTKYKGQKIDAIISSDDHALNFLLGLGKDLFPETPVIFCGVNGYDPSRHKGDGRDLTGVVETIDIKATLDTALRLHPHTKEVAYIADRSLTGQALRAMAERVFQDYGHGLKFRYLEHRIMEELQEEVAALSDGSIVLAFIFSRDELGRIWSHEHNLRRVAAYCPVPIYSVWEFYLGHGIVGGMLTSGQAHGETAAHMCLRILGGEKASDIPVILDSPNRYMFDYMQLKRFGPRELSLPQGSVVLHKPYSIYERYTYAVWTGGLALVLLAALVVFLWTDIRIRKKSAAELARREATLESIFRAAPIGIGLVSDRVFTRVNTYLCETFGYSKDELLGQSARMLYPSDEAFDWVGREKDAQIKEQGAATIETRWQRKDGKIRDILLSATPLDPSDLSLGITFTALDITERRRGEEELLRSEKKYKALSAEFEAILDHLPALVFYKDKEGNYLRVNRYVADAHGLSKEELRGKSTFELYPAEEAEGYLKNDLEVIRSGEPKLFIEELWQTEEGKKWVSTSKIPFVDNNGIVSGIIGVSIDITDRKLAQEALAEEHHKLLSIFDSTDEPIYVADPKTYELLFVNEAFKKYWGDAVGQICHKALQNLDAPCPFCTNDIIFGEKLGKTHIWEFQNRTTDRWFRCIDRAIEWPDGREVRYEMAIDITDQKASQKEVEKYKQHLEELVQRRTIELESANKELEDFAYSVSHDLRAPLRSIYGFARIISNRFRDDLSEDAQHYFENILQASTHMGTLIDDLLRYSRLGRKALRRQNVSLTVLLKEIKADLSGRLDELEVTLTIAEDLPVVESDPTLLRTIFANLIDNAVAYHREELPREIEVGAKTENDRLTVTVADNGIGISKEFHEKIFNIFQRLHPQHEYPGTGIGLAIVKRSADMLNGRVWVESEPGKGSTFYVELPLKMTIGE